LEKESFGSTRQLKIGLCLFVAALLQVSLVQFVSTGLRRIDWLLLVVVYLGLQQRNHWVVLLTATVAGVIKDASSGAGIIAVSGIAYLFAAYIADRIASIIVLDNLMIRFGTVAAASFVNTILQLIVYQILGLDVTHLTGQEGILAVIVLSLIANLFASVLVFYLMDRLFKATSGIALRRTQAMRGMRRKFRR
jgi:rod shape-determining protein MreD